MKKVISFVLVLALVLGSFSMAFALTDIEGNDNAEAINVVNDLGIVTGYTDGSFQPEKAVNRAEFAAMITRALGVPESALAGYTATSFKDTTGYGWAVKYLAFCADKGIIVGDGNGNVMPGRTINVNEAMTMVLRAVGYTNNSAVLVGTWPGNYVTLAQDLELYDDVAAVATVDRASAAQIIYNSLTLQKVQVAADGATAGLWVVDALGNNTAPVTMLTSGLGCEAQGLAVIDGEEPAIINLKGYQGAYAETYTKDGEIVAVSNVESTFLTGTYTSASGIFETLDEVEYKLATSVAITAGGFVITNGVAGSASTANAQTVMPTDDVTYTIAVSLTGKRVDDIYSVARWTVSVGDDIEAADLDEIADDQTLFSQKFELNDDDEIDTTAFEILGAASLDDIEEGDIVYVYTGSDNYIKKIEVGTETVTGTVTKDTGVKFTINGKVYELAGDNAANLVDAIVNTDIDAGMEGTATLDYAGNIYGWTGEDNSVGNYALYVAYDETVSFGTTTTAVKLFTAAGETITPDTDGITKGALGFVETDIVQYSLNKDGELDKITTNAGVSNTAISGDVAKDGSLIGKTKVAKDVVVFVKDGDDYAIGKMADLAETVTSMKVVTKDGKIVAIYADGNDLGQTSSTYGIVTESGSKGVDADGYETDVISVIIDGAAKEDVITAEVTDAAIDTTGLREIKLDSDGNVSEINVADVYATGAATTVEAIDGDIVDLEGVGSFKVAADAVIYIYDTEAQEWTVAKSLTAVRKLVVTLYDVDGAADGTDKDNVYDIILAVK